MRIFILVNLWAIALLMGARSAAAATDNTDSTYRLGSGYTVGETGLSIGGYANTELDVPRSTPWNFTLSDLSLFMTWDNGSRLHFFSELEAGDVLNVGNHQSLGAQNAHFEFERFYLDSLVNNNLTVRLGKFLTPIGEWNLIHAAPLVWTTSRPVVTENLFSPHASGLMLHGSVPVVSRQLEYSVFADLTESIDPYRSSNPFQNALGAHLRYFFSDTLQIGASVADYTLSDLQSAQIGSSFTHIALSNLQSSRYYLVGLNLAWSYKKFELSSEFVYRTSDHAAIASTLQGFVQGVVPISQRWFMVGRYEYFEQQLNKAGQVGLLGLAYRPLPPIVWKLEYRRGEHNELLAPDGLSASFSILF
ncbi:MAG: hypothetical protein WCG16_01790 [Methylococcales bacterium]